MWAFDIYFWQVVLCSQRWIVHNSVDLCTSSSLLVHFWNIISNYMYVWICIPCWPLCKCFRVILKQKMYFLTEDNRFDMPPQLFALAVYLYGVAYQKSSILLFSKEINETWALITAVMVSLYKIIHDIDSGVARMLIIIDAQPENAGAWCHWRLHNLTWLCSCLIL